MLAPVDSDLPREKHDALVQSILEAPPMYRAAKDIDLATLAARYVSGLALNHGFMRGSKVAGLMSAYVFLGLNGYDVDASETEFASMVNATADRELSEQQLAAWIRSVMLPTNAV